MPMDYDDQEDRDTSAETEEMEPEAVEEEFPDQTLFEPDPELENRPPGWWRRVGWPIIQVVVAATALVSLLYISGVYQALLLTPTSESIRQPALEPVVDGPVLTVPVQVFLLSEEGSLSTSRGEANAKRLVENASRIWAQAGIELTLKDIQVVEISAADREFFLARPGQYIQTLPAVDSDTVNVILTGTLQGLNGVAFGGTRSLAVADKVSHFDYRTLAHELGHLFGLDHTTDSQRVMSQGSYGTQLTEREVRQARDYAQAVF